MGAVDDGSARDQSAPTPGTESLVKHRTRSSPRSRLPGAKSAKQDRKLAQLCAQVEEIVSLALGDSADHRLHDLVVQSVSPGPDGARLLVAVVATNPVDMDSLEELRGALESARPWLRQQVAAEIYRKRTPDLAFQVLPPWEEDE